jgi:hypothetical protein
MEPYEKSIIVVKIVVHWLSMTMRISSFGQKNQKKVIYGK